MSPLSDRLRGSILLLRQPLSGRLQGRFSAALGPALWGYTVGGSIQLGGQSFYVGISFSILGNSADSNKNAARRFRSGYWGIVDDNKKEFGI